MRTDFSLQQSPFIMPRQAPGLPSARVQFAGAEGVAAKAAVKKMGTVEFLRTVSEYLRKAENKQILKAMLYEHGIPAAAFVSCLAGPPGWILAAGLGLTHKFWTSKKADALKATIDTNKISGPMARIQAIKAEWAKQTKESVGVITKEYNRLLDELFMDEKQFPKMRPAVQKMKLKPDGRVVGLLTRFVEAQQHFSNKLLWRAGSFLRQGPKSAALSFLKAPMRVMKLSALGVGLQGILMFLYSKNKIAS